MNTIKKYGRKRWKRMLCPVIISLGFFMLSLSVSAKTDSMQEFADTYAEVTLSPDKTAFTIQGSGSAERNKKGYQLKVGRAVSRKTPEKGHHIYTQKVSKNVDISYWEVMHVNSQCIHGHDKVGSTFGGLLIKGDICGASYDNGWFPVCADCGKYVFQYMVYASSSQLRNIKTMVGSGKYYYLCPFSGALEQGIEYAHKCEALSSNRYTIFYEANAPEGEVYGGATAQTYHMYNNDKNYEGKEASYTDTQLRVNGYYIPGYVFTGWNTQADGSGTSYKDGQKVINLTDENGKRVILYAQWKKVETTLKIDANGGKYAGKNPFLATQAHGTKLELFKSSVTPPTGYSISFQENGGTACKDIVTEKSFSHFEAQSGFEGRLSGNIYYFTSENTGHTDVIKLCYTDRTILLPMTTKNNWSFAGWYYDPALTQYCGMAGEEMAFEKKTTLYAKWMPLTLYSENIYDSKVNGGKGAVNLWWEQKDNNPKIYRLYQSTDKTSWKQVADSGAVQTGSSINKTFTYQASGNVYTITENGYYEIAAYGAKGADYSSGRKGGSGGKAAATYWLKKGDVITSYVGTEGNGKNGGVNGNGANGGSSSSDSARGGGGASEVYITRGGVTTLLLSAGGGGGANEQAGGGNGGEATAAAATRAGAATDAGGGGGGYKGGTKLSNGLTIGKTTKSFSYTGDVQVFTALYTTTYTFEAWGAQGGSNSAEMMGGAGGYAKGTYSLSSGEQIYVYVGGAGGNASEGRRSGGYNGGGNGGRRMSGASSLNPNPAVGSGGGGATHIARTNRGVLKNYEAYRTELLLVAGGGGGATEKCTDAVFAGGAGGGTTGGVGAGLWRNSCAGGTQTTGYRFGQGADGCDGTDIGWSGSGSGGGGGGFFGGYANDGGLHDENGAHRAAAGAGGSGYIGGVKNGSMKNGQRKGNGYAVITCDAAEGFYMAGGSNYINTSFCAKNTASEAGKNSGAGKVTLVSKGIGYYEVTRKNGVKATDYTAPEAIKADTVAVKVRKSAENKVTYGISFPAPEDKGTVYYHKAESYLLSTQERLSVSNITENTLTTGYRGIYYYVDTKTGGAANASDAFCGDTELTYTGNKNTIYYLHMAPVDHAGNIGGTTTIRLQTMETDSLEVWNFPPVTESIGIRVSAFNDETAHSPLYEREGRVYVRADGSTAFTLPVTAHIRENMERKDYQVNTIRYNVLRLPSSNVMEWFSGYVENGKNKEYTNASLIITNKSNRSYLEAVYGTAARDATGGLTLYQDVVFYPTAESNTLRIYPSAYANTTQDGTQVEVASEDALDRQNYITVITDSAAPEILGLEKIASCDPLNMSEEFMSFTVKATDAVSGLGSFTLRIDNQDNLISRTIADQEDGARDGVIRLRIPKYYEGSKEGLEFCGNFTVTAYAADNVGNVRTEKLDVAGEALNAQLERVLAPKEPIFRCGESGVLTIQTWGYVEKIETEFPGELTGELPDLNRTILCTENAQEEKIEFMIPLSCPEGEYQVIVRGYKEGTDLEQRPQILSFTVKGSVLDELRTRLR